MLRTCAASCAVVIFCMLIFSGQTYAQSSAALITLTNQQRAAAGLKPLVENRQLAASSQAKAQDMLQRGYWAHYAPDNTSPWDFMHASDYAFSYAGENLAKGFSDDQSVMDAWMQSPGHRQNILNPNFRDIGVTVMGGRLLGDEVSLVVVHYGVLQTPKTAPAAHQPKPVSRVGHALNMSWIITLQSNHS